MTTSLSVVGRGLVTAVGFNAASTLAALRAGVSGVRQSAWIDPASGESLSVAKVDLPHWWEGVGKLAELVAPAVWECLQAALPEPAESIPILIGTADPARAGRTPGLDETLLDEVHARLDIARHPRSALFAADQTGSAHALLEAHRLIAAGTARCVVVAGVDSFLHQSTLDSYAERLRLITPDNSNGFFPGEAGAAVLLRASHDAPSGSLRIIGIGIGREDATIDGTQPLRADGLTRAVKQALSDASVTMHDIGFRVTDLSGEHYKFKEAAIVMTRTDSGDRDEPLALWHPVEYLGEIGAAILPCLLAWAAHAFEQGYGTGSLALCHIGSDSGMRAALVVGRSA